MLSISGECVTPGADNVCTKRVVNVDSLRGVEGVISEEQGQEEGVLSLGLHNIVIRYVNHSSSSCAMPIHQCQCFIIL